MKELASVIMPVYNNSIYLTDSIEGILNQTYKDLELIIVDDCSTDLDVRDILKGYENNDHRVKTLFCEKNQGPGIARNIGINEARGRYLAFCDSDDIWLPEKLDKQISFLKERNCALCYSSFWIIDDTKGIRGFAYAPEKLTLNQLKKDNKIGCSTAVMDIERTGKVFMPDIKKRQDWAYFLILLKNCGNAFGISEPLILYTRHSSSVSSRKMSLFKYNAQIYQIVFGYSIARSYVYLILVFLPSYFIKKAGNKILFMKQKRLFKQHPAGTLII